MIGFVYILHMPLTGITCRMTPLCNNTVKAPSIVLVHNKLPCKETSIVGGEKNSFLRCYCLPHFNKQLVNNKSYYIVFFFYQVSSKMKCDLTQLCCSDRVASCRSVMTRGSIRQPLLGDLERAPEGRDKVAIEQGPVDPLQRGYTVVTVTINKKAKRYNTPPSQVNVQRQELRGWIQA